MSKPSNTQSLTQGALSAAVFIVLLLIFVYIPLLNMMALFFLPVPFVLHMYKHGLKSTALVGVVSLFLTLIITPLPFFFITILAASVGIVMGYFYQRGKSAFAPILAGMLAYLGNYLMMMLISFLLFDINMIESIQEFMREGITFTEETADDLAIPLDEEQLSLFKESLDTISLIFPAFMIFSSITMTLIHHWVNRLTLNRLGYSIERLPFFREWNFPKSIIYLYLICLFFILIGQMQEGGTFYLLIINLQYMLEIILFIQGLSLLACYSIAKNMGKSLPILAIVLTFFLPVIMSTIIRLLGLLDLGIGLKRRVTQE